MIHILSSSAIYYKTVCFIYMVIHFTHFREIYISDSAKKYQIHAVILSSATTQYIQPQTLLLTHFILKSPCHPFSKSLPFLAHIYFKSIHTVIIINIEKTATHIKAGKVITTFPLWNNFCSCIVDFKQINFTRR